MALRIRLEYQNEIIAEVSSDDINQELTIGRSRECTWCVPVDDIAVGRRHVRLYRKGKAVMLEDLGSRNGSYLDGRRISRRVRLKAGQRISIGKSVITVDSNSSIASNVHFRPYLEVRSGLRKGVRVAVDPKGVRIGSDPESELVLLDDLLISRTHAFVGYSEGGACWVEDCGSMNGTRVDGEMLAADRKRPLKPGSIIQVAHVDIAYTDGSLLRKRGRLKRSLAVAFASLVLAYGSYLGYQLIFMDHIDQIMEDARETAKKEQFIQAQTTLSKAVDARGYNKARALVDELRSLINDWQDTATRWRRVEGVLGDSNAWISADSALQAVITRRLADDLNHLCEFTTARNWEWDASRSPLYAKQAVAAKRVVDRWLTVIELTHATDLDYPRLIREIKALDTAIQDAQKGEASIQILRGICGVARRTRDEAESLGEALGRMNQWLALLATRWPPPLDEAMRELRLLADSGQPSARSRSQELLPVLTELKRSYEEMLTRMDSARRMDFAGALKSVALPPRELCARHEATSELRDRIERSIDSVQKTLMQAQSWHRQTSTALTALGGVEGLINRWSDPALLEGLRRYDCLAGPYPRRTRIEPAGTYDRILGVESFYEALRGETPNTQSRVWKPEIFILASTFSTVDAALAAFKNENMRWLLSDKLGEHVNQLHRVSVFREQLTKTFEQEAENVSGRDALMIAGMALLVARHPDSLHLGGIPLRNWVRDQLADMRSELLALDREYPLATAERQIKIREMIMDLGLPGDPVVRQYWLRRVQ